MAEPGRQEGSSLSTPPSYRGNGRGGDDGAVAVDSAVDGVSPIACVPSLPSAGHGSVPVACPGCRQLRAREAAYVAQVAELSAAHAEASGAREGLEAERVQAAQVEYQRFEKLGAAFKVRMGAMEDDASGVSAEVRRLQAEIDELTAARQESEACIATLTKYVKDREDEAAAAAEEAAASDGADVAGRVEAGLVHAGKVASLLLSRSAAGLAGVIQRAVLAVRHHRSRAADGGGGGGAAGLLGDLLSHVAACACDFLRESASPSPVVGWTRKLQHDCNTNGVVGGGLGGGSEVEAEEGDTLCPPLPLAQRPSPSPPPASSSSPRVLQSAGWVTRHSSICSSMQSKVERSAGAKPVIELMMRAAMVRPERSVEPVAIRSFR